MKEFLRREFLWATQLNVLENCPFADLAGALDPSIRCDLNEIAFATTTSESSAEARCVRQMMHWYKIIELAPLAAQQHYLLDPYEPLMILFQRRGCFASEHRIFIEVNRVVTVNYDVLKHSDSWEPLSLEHDLLDKIDGF